MRNQIYTGTPTSPRFFLCPTTVKSGDFVLIGSVPGVALDDYSATTGGTTFYTGGSFTLTVNAWTGTSPLTGSAINPGDVLYANSGTLDSTTNVTTGNTISKNTGGTKMGTLDQSTAVTSGSTTTATVRLEGEE